MKKVIISALSIIMMTGASVFAQDVVTTKDSTSTVTKTTTASPVKTEIKIAELPQPVAAAINGLKSQGWIADETVYAINGNTDQVVFYTVTLKNATAGKTKIVNFDTAGKMI